MELETSFLVRGPNRGTQTQYRLIDLFLLLLFVLLSSLNSFFSTKEAIEGLTFSQVNLQ